jgi:hypothetical protein
MYDDQKVLSDKLLLSGATHEIVGGDVLGAPHEKRLILNGEMSFMTMDIRTVSIAVWMYGPPRTSAPTVYTCGL